MEEVESKYAVFGCSESKVDLDGMSRDQLINTITFLRIVIRKFKGAIGNISRSVDNISFHSEEKARFIFNQNIARLEISKEVCAKLSEIGIVYIGDLCVGYKEGLVMLLEMLGVENPEEEAVKIENALNELRLSFVG